jgi:rod shape-determining protein MreD
MKPLGVIAALGLALAGQAGVGALWPDASRYVDLLFVPTVWYALAASQRAGLLVGCAAGLLQDAWFQSDVFGLNGFNKTAIGWALGGLGERFDVGGPPARLVYGMLAALADGLMSFGLRGMLDPSAPVLAPVPLVVKVLVTGGLVAGAFGVTGRLAGGRTGRTR